jgi:metal-responsive CopG/Arc/MetJ family transcriptional regulator
MWHILHMRTVQLTLDEDLVEQVDALAARLGTSRSAFTRQALREALAQRRVRAKERRHRLGYQKKPAGKKEFSVWHGEQVWPE